ncbi:hypothetical protein ACVBEH_17110 [Roseateles sp. GG27B]
MTTNYADTAGGATPEPTKEKAPGVDRTEGLKEHLEVSQHFNGAADDKKEFATLRARFALKGFELVGSSDGSFYASRWGHLVLLADAAQALTFLNRAGGTK